ncbi:hypothetical protein [Fuerstiella marisgermanici]|uniref:DUF1573 domain-containing protein n=1 Tax=Fuerstiella marisgermanici TaxID=1891926 RepID=A0A1P8WI08_9PLAN|nr:hypothetical protein [Fuerstiella marisgermanici]APZ93696.1 hypothetical protein Fuma_03314 [Fuerstiella marisgermanici]
MSLLKSPFTLKSAAVFVLFAVVGGALASIDWRGEQLAATPPAPVLDISPVDLNLGEVWLQKELPFELTVRNTSRRPVKVIDFSASCNCTNLSPTEFTVPASGSTVVRGVIDLTRSVADLKAARSGFSVTLSAETTRRSSATLKWPLRGTALRVLDVSPSSIDLLGGNEVVQDTWSPTVEVKILPQMDLVDVKPEWNAGEADVEFEGPDWGGEYVLRYTPRTNLAVGDIDTRINLRSKLADGSPGPEIEIPVQGVVVPPVRLSPAKVAISKPRTATTAQAQNRSTEVSVVQIVSLNGTEWRVVEILDQPDWLITDISKTRAITLGLTANVSTEEPIIIHVVVEAETGKRCKLPLTINLMQIGGITGL